MLHQTSNISKKNISQKDEIKILQKLVKQRRESASIFSKQNRYDLAKLEENQANYIAKFLPQQLKNHEIETIVLNVIANLNLNEIKDIGKVIGIVIKKTEGKADGKRISDIVKEKLSR